MKIASAESTGSATKLPAPSAVDCVPEEAVGGVAELDPEIDVPLAPDVGPLVVFNPLLMLLLLPLLLLELTPDAVDTAMGTPTIDAASVTVLTDVNPSAASEPSSTHCPSAAVADGSRDAYVHCTPSEMVCEGTFATSRTMEMCVPSCTTVSV